MKVIGVLALQGPYVEHCHMLEKIDHVTPMEVKNTKDLYKIDSLILPGGESTTLGKLLKDFNLVEPMAERIRNGMPVWGTCAGMILLAKKIVDEENTHLAVMDIEVRRNSYGSQLDSFFTRSVIGEIAKDPLPLIFIRAPWIESIHNDVQILAEYEGKIIAARQKNMLCTSFHPEMTTDISFHQYFAKMDQLAPMARKQIV